MTMTFMIIILTLLNKRFSIKVILSHLQYTTLRFTELHKNYVGVVPENLYVKGKGDHSEVRDTFFSEFLNMLIRSL